MDSTFSDITSQLDKVTGASGSVASHVGPNSAQNAQLTSTLAGLSSNITNITQNNNKGGLSDPTTMLVFAMMASQKHASTTVYGGPGFYGWRSSW